MIPRPGFCFVVFFKKWFLVLRFWQVCEEQRETTGGIRVGRATAAEVETATPTTFPSHLSLIAAAATAAASAKKSSIGGGSDSSAVISRVFSFLLRYDDDNKFR